MPTLIARSGPLSGQRFELEGVVILGREDANITMADEETSRRHAAIRIVAGKAIIEDLGSTNGTFVQGRRIDAATELVGGETIKLGQTIFDVEIEVEVPPEPEPEPIIDAGATRIAQPSPEPVADPDRTSLRPRPSKPEPSPEPVADPDRTSLRPRPSKPEPSPEPVADPDRTSLRPRPPAPEPPAPEPDRTSRRARPSRPAREPEPVAAAAPAAAEQPFGSFAPPAARRRRGVATRKLGPSLVSFATIIGTAAALVIYFVGR